MMAANDALARGAKSVTFPSNSHIDQRKWDAAFQDVPEKSTNKNVSKRPSRKSS
jgi:hypothetical protein